MVEKLEGEGFMHVWLQPVDATPGDPMVQLDVSAQSFINGKPGSGFDAINGVDKPCLCIVLVFLAPFLIPYFPLSS